ncbi:hypothetical protein [Desulfonatronum lacustre]|uniref:hypothetical protein n=1 Tax=Desulfonatronum lacustre TaxID=66849 RepID=UPI00048C3E98|nr:hypothetical protein [Desulfonatronum lacustre]
MSQNTVNDPKLKEESNLLAKEVFTPVLQVAVKKAVDAKHSQNAILNGSLYAFAGMLTMILGGEKNTAALLRDFADHLEQHGLEQPEPGEIRQ